MKFLNFNFNTKKTIINSSFYSTFFRKTNGVDIYKNFFFLKLIFNFIRFSDLNSFKFFKLYKFLFNKNFIFKNHFFYNYFKNKIYFSKNNELFLLKKKNIYVFKKQKKQNFFKNLFFNIDSNLIKNFRNFNFNTKNTNFIKYNLNFIDKINFTCCLYHPDNFFSYSMPYTKSQLFSDSLLFKKFTIIYYNKNYTNSLKKNIILKKKYKYSFFKENSSIFNFLFNFSKKIKFNFNKSSFLCKILYKSLKYDASLIFFNQNTIKVNKKYKNNLKNAILNIFYMKDIFNFKGFNFTNYSGLFSNKFILKNLNIFDNMNFNNRFILKDIEKKILKNNKMNLFNNYYPISFLPTKGKKRYISKFKFNYSSTYFSYFQNNMLCFFEGLFEKKIFLKITTNFFRSYTRKEELDRIIEEYKFVQPHYMKNFLLIDFLEIVWYSFFLKDVTMMSSWITRFMESIHFRNHKKFLSFFTNFIKKYAAVFIHVLRIKGFFFDIRGKVGVTGNSKKRHLFIKVGTLNKSSKKNKINFNQNLVRTPSGVLGLTYILNY